MTHLTPAQFVDVLEGTARQDALRHLADCETCRHEAGSLESVLHGARSVEWPEPSPLFWDHFSRRVEIATRHEPVPSDRHGWRDVAAMIVTSALAVATLALVLVVRTAPISPENRGRLVSTAAMGPSVDAGGTAGASDEAWRVIADVASELPDVDVSQAVVPDTDTTAALIDQLTPEQRRMLVKLIKAQMGGAE